MNNRIKAYTIYDKSFFFLQPKCERAYKILCCYANKSSGINPELLFFSEQGIFVAKNGASVSVLGGLIERRLNFCGQAGFSLLVF